MGEGRNRMRALKWQDAALGMAEVDYTVGPASLPEKGTL